MADVAWDPAATGANNGTSWADAYTTIAAAVTGAGASGKIYMASTGVELISASQTFSSTLLLAPILISSDKTSGFPPTVELAGARIGSTNSTNLTLLGSFFSKGVFFTAGEGSTATRNLAFDSGTGEHIIRMVGGGVELRNTGAASRITLGTGATNRRTRYSFENIEHRFGNAGQGYQCNVASLSIKDGATAGSAITELIKLFNLVVADVRVDGLDMSSCATAVQLLPSAAGVTGSAIFSNIKAPASWSGSLMATPPAQDSLYARAYNVDSASTNYRMIGVGFNGTMRSETTIVRTGGATDGTTPLSWRMETTTQSYPLTSLRTDPIAVWNTGTSSITATVEVITNNVTLKDDECWIEVGYLDDTGTPLGAFISDEKSSQLVAGTDQTASTDTWTTTGLTTPVKQKLSVTFTPDKAGFIYAIVHLARSNTVVYVDPEITVT